MRPIPACVAAALLAAASSRAALQIDLQVVAVTGGPAPGASGVLAAVGPPRVNAQGQAALTGGITTVVGLESDGAVFRWNGSGLDLVARQGDAVPGVSGAVFSEFAEGSIDESGRVVFVATLWRDGLPSEGIFEWDGASLVPLVIRGDQVSGSPPFVTLGVPNLADAGHAVFGANGYDGYWALAPNGDVVTVIQAGDPAPGLPGVTLESTLPPPEDALVNDAGDVAFSARVWDGTLESLRQGVWGPDGAGGVTLLGVASNAAPGAPGTVFRSMEAVDLGNGGEVAFIGRLYGAVTEFDDAGIWRSDAGATALLVRAGDPAPDPQERDFGWFGAPQLDGAGRAYFVAHLVEAVPGMEEDALGFWRADADGTIVELLRSGEPADADPGVLLSEIRGAAVAARGDAILEVRLSGDEVDMGSDEALLYLSAEGERALVFREGDLLEIAPGIWRTGEGPGIGVDGWRASARDAISENGHVGFSVFVEEGYTSVVATVPEPGGPILALTGALVLAAQRRTNRRTPRQSA